MKNKYKLEISKFLVNKLIDFSSKTNNEVCGVLIGKEIKCNHIIITDVILDKNSLNASRFSVTRNTKGLYPNVKEIVRNSVYNDVDFIGDWHSHPFGTSLYSFIDYYSMNAMLNDPDYYFLNSIVLIIVRPPNMVSSFLFQRDKKNPKKMKIIMK